MGSRGSDRQQIRRYRIRDYCGLSSDTQITSNLRVRVRVREIALIVK